MASVGVKWKARWPLLVHITVAIMVINTMTILDWWTQWKSEIERTIDW